MPQRTPPAATPHAFKGLRDWIEVFFSGQHVDSKGRAASFTNADLDQMVANVAGAGVPAVLGHPEHDDPAYAWAREVRRDGDKLLVKFDDIDPAFAEAVDAGRYRERSVSVLKDQARGWVLQHVGWLGAATPALTGLKALSYAAPPNGADTYEFAATNDDMATGGALSDLARLMRGLREYLIADKGLETADRVLPDWTVSSLAEQATAVLIAAREETRGEANPLFNRGPGATPMPNPTNNGAAGANGAATTYSQADLDAARIAAATEATTAQAAQFAAAQTALTALQAERRAERIGVQIAGWKAAALVTPAEEPGLAEFMAALEAGTADGGKFAFAAADNSQVSSSPTDWFAKFVAGRKAVLKLGAASNAGDEPNAATEGLSDADIAAQALQYQRAQEVLGRRISVGRAIDEVTNGTAKR